MHQFLPASEPLKPQQATAISLAADEALRVVNSNLETSFELTTQKSDH
jgi:hypothetical protein